MLLEFVAFTWLESLAVGKGAFFENYFGAVLLIVGFPLSDFHCLLTKIATHLKAHELVKDHSLDL